MISIINTSLPHLTVVGQALIVLLLLLYFFDRKNALLKFFQKNSVKAAFVVAFVATFGSLFYSEIMGFEPCKLCWFQRIFMYPQMILFGMALWKHERVMVVRNAVVLSAIGGAISLYHYLLQIGVMSGVNCGVVGFSAQCSQRFFMTFGYITIPMMALTAFAMIIGLFLFSRNVSVL